MFIIYIYIHTYIYIYIYIYFFVQFKKREKHLWRSDTFKGLQHSPLGVFHVTLVLLLIMRSQSAYFLNCMNWFKLRKASYVR